MAGNIIGGIKASETNKKRYGKDFYKSIGAMGGSKSRGGGFASDVVGADGLTGRERSVIVGIRGGMVSKRGKAIKLNQGE
jgi:hypothetical protein